MYEYNGPAVGPEPSTEGPFFFTNLKEGFMYIITMHLVYLKYIVITEFLQKLSKCIRHLNCILLHAFKEKWVMSPVMSLSTQGLKYKLNAAADQCASDYWYGFDHIY